MAQREREWHIESDTEWGREAQAARTKYPWPEMSAGDSISFDTDEEFHRARVAGSSWLQRHAELRMRVRSESFGEGCGGRVGFVGEESVDASDD